LFNSNSYIVNKKSTYNHSVTIKREEWLNRFRDDIGDLFAGFYTIDAFYLDDSCRDKRLEILSKAEAARAKIIVRLKTDGSSGNERNLELKSVLGSFTFKTVEHIDKVIIDKILIYSSEILIREWSKIKKESK